MVDTTLREKLRSDVQATNAAELLPHHRRGALMIVQPSADLLDVAVAVAEDDSQRVQKYLEQHDVYKPSLSELTDWCVDLEIRFQYVILQPYVLAQAILKSNLSLS